MPVLASDASVLPSIDFVRSKYYYCEIKGILYKKDKYFKLVDGKPRGNFISDTDKHGYVRVTCGGKSMLAHRVIWAVHYGEWPPANLQIDHINRVRTDNKISNLRLVTQKENSQNSIRVLGKGGDRVERVVNKQDQGRDSA